MTQLAREELFSPDEIACVHVMNRAVRRCFLMGDDPLSGKNFDHRKVWLEKKIELQAANFGIDVLGIAILSNHFHLERQEGHSTPWCKKFSKIGGKFVRNLDCVSVILVWLEFSTVCAGLKLKS